MRKHNNNRGFTMAELLIVVAILVVLAGVAFIAVQNQQRSMTRLEYDTIAKEIFIAAQNHLTMAESQGYSSLGSTAFGNPANSTVDKREPSYRTPNTDYFYIEVLNGRASAGAEMLRLMLPDGAIDPTIYNGDFIIRYQKSSGTVLDVFYSNPSSSRTFLTVNGMSLSGEYTNLIENYRGDAKTNDRLRLMVGWYGDGDALPVGERLLEPLIEIHNEDKLWVTVKELNPRNPISNSLVLTVTGKTSGTTKTFRLVDETAVPAWNPDSDPRIDTSSYVSTGEIQIILDDITTNTGTSTLHFSSLTGFEPGEDIIVQASAFSNKRLTNIPYSEKKTTNSLFESKSGSTAYISRFRHLENLDESISSLSASLAITNAVQKKSLIWDSSVYPNIYYSSGGIAATGYYSPISPTGLISYDGNSNSITAVEVNYSGDSGLFGSFGATGVSTTIKNLKLENFSITGTTSAGALAGTLTGTQVTNVIARNTGIDGSTKYVKNIVATGSAGGLIGVQDGGSVNYSAAALIVDGNTAGGLIGTVQNSASITGCYSAGHTKNGSYDEWTGISGHFYDVTGTTAGGLVGDAGSTSISYSYSTCSVNASSRGGGFAAVTTGKITNCYCTGRVLPDFVTDANDKQVLMHNAFRTQLEGGGLAAGSSGYYYQIINEVLDAETNQIEYKDPYRLPESNAAPAIAAFDESAGSYNSFVGPASDWKDARPYDNATLGKYYNGKYNLKTVLQLAGSYAPTGSENYFIKDHYGDWPAPEIFIINN